MRVPLLVTAMIFSACDQLMVLHADVPSICQHLENQTFSIPPAVRARYQLFPAELASGVSLSHTFEFDVSVQVPAELSKLQASFSLTSVKLTAKNDGNFAFLDNAALTLEGPDGSSVQATTISYKRTEPSPTVVAWNGDGLDLAPYLATGTLRYATSLTGTLPPGDVTVDVDACASAAFSLDYLQQ